jgi:mono/diheme cytochrome c family protein
VAKGFVVGFLTAVAAAFVAAYLFLISGRVPANADASPGRLETWMAGTSLDATLAREAPKGPNPVPISDANLIEGINLYAQHCALCHGTAAGDSSASPVAKGLYPRPPQLATDGVEDDAEGISFWKIKHGIRWTGMPSWGGALTDQQIWTLALFLKHMNNLPPAAQDAWQKVGN